MITQKCKIVLPDAGPLISLGKIHSLDLLFHLKMEILVMDVVFEETTSNKKYEETQYIKNFFLSHQELIKIIPTYEGFRLKEEAELGIEKRKHLGEKTIFEFLLNEKNIFPSLVLFEDKAVLKSLPLMEKNGIHYLSTFGFLFGLEECKIVHSAQELFKALEKSGRIISQDVIDISSNKKTSWKPRR